MTTEDLVRQELKRLYSSLGSERELDAVRAILDQPIQFSSIHISRPKGDDYRKELIQIAASAVAAVIDYELLSLNNDRSVSQVTNEVWVDVLQERARQDNKFSPLPRGLDPLVWLAVLKEELCETAREIELEVETP